jgi:hypothetical protein
MQNFCFSAGDMDARFSVSEAPGLPIGKAEYLLAFGVLAVPGRVDFD